MLNTSEYLSFKSFTILKTIRSQKPKIKDFHKNFSVLTVRNLLTLKITKVFSKLL
ncbi:hypothetical protein SAMN05421594_2554 [Chryseobacterium oleae]|uniref:Uncharacterized protein n=1 Tax=Chryseobacterium oleae TaxID=491207 RepID=A0A1I4YNS5_CHROL|nr:hypothetical protein SAMN05421594_2554 [Chryseobacterium oleae]